MAAFGEDLARLALSDKWLMTVGKQLIRTHVIQTQASMSGKQKRSQKDPGEQQLSPSKRQRKRKSTSDKNDTQEVQDMSTLAHSVTCVITQQCSPCILCYLCGHAVVFTLGCTRSHLKWAWSVQGHSAEVLRFRCKGR